MQEVEETAGLREPVPSGLREPVSSGLRERKKRARREALVDATHRLAAEHGLEHVTVEAICAEVGVSVRTFFNYFETKDDAVLGLGQWALDPDASEVFAAGGPTGDLLADLQVLVGSILEHPPLGPDRMARAFELAKQHPELLVRAYVQIHSQHEAVAGLARRRLEATPGATDDALVHVVGALMMVLSHATFERWGVRGNEGEVGDHLPSIVTDLRALLLGAPVPAT
jgi:AcrR family transcriptional regulator